MPTTEKEKSTVAKAVARRTPAAEFLKAHGACPEARQWVAEAKIKTLGEAWLKCENPQWMTWALEAIGYNDEKLRLFACWCVRNTPLPDGRVTWDLLTDERSKAAVEVAERFARGKASEEERSAAESAARSAAWSAAWSAAESAQAKALRKIVNPFRS